MPRINPTTIKQFDRVYGTYRPQRLDTLTDEGMAFTGWTGWFVAIWPIEAEDSSLFVGQWAMQPDMPVESRLRRGIAWVPSGDVESAEPE